MHSQYPVLSDEMYQVNVASAVFDNLSQRPKHTKNKHGIKVFARLNYQLSKNRCNIYFTEIINCSQPICVDSQLKYGAPL